MKKPKKEYLGDGVYVAFDGWALVLTTEDGVSVTNRIVLEDVVLASLNAYVEALKSGLKGDEDGVPEADDASAD